jgi:hypothetical protein
MPLTQGSEKTPKKKLIRKEHDFIMKNQTQPTKTIQTKKNFISKVVNITDIIMESLRIKDIKIYLNKFTSI